MNSRLQVRGTKQSRVVGLHETRTCFMQRFHSDKQVPCKETQTRELTKGTYTKPNRAEMLEHVCERKKQTHLNIRTYENGFTLFSGNEPMHSTQSRNMVSLKMTFSILHHGQARSCSGLAACKRPTSGRRLIIAARTNPTSRICTSQRRRRASTPSADTFHGRPSFTPGSPKGACLHGGSERQAA